MKYVVTCVVLVCVLVTGVQAEHIWDLEAVDADGVGTHPKAGASMTEANKVVIEGIALNDSDAQVDPAFMWQVYVQSDTQAPVGNYGGIAVFAGKFYNPDWPRYPFISAGDRIRVEGWIIDYNGKVNLNERHSTLGVFEVTVLQEDAGLPQPQVIPSVADAVYFDATRTGGGEYYQGQLVRLHDLVMVEGTWQADGEVTVTDGTATMTLKLGRLFDTNIQPRPTTRFSATGIWDQEDETFPHTGDYRLWVMGTEDIRVHTLQADLNNDGAVEWADFGIFAGQWQATESWYGQ